jgi:hypothetical protein
VHEKGIDLAFTQQPIRQESLLSLWIFLRILLKNVTETWQQWKARNAWRREK